MESRSGALAYDDVGNGPVVILIHGFPLSRRMWRPQLEPLVAAGFRVIAPDLPGFGESGLPPVPCAIEDYANEIAALMERLGIEKAIVGGMSMGGYILLSLLERYPERVSAACFLFTRCGADDAAGKARRTALADEVAKGNRQVVEAAFAQVLFAARTVEENPSLVEEVQSWMRSTSPEGLVGALTALRDRKDFTSFLESIAVPCFVAGAAEDRAVPPESNRVFIDRLRQVTSCLIPNAGHMANMEQPELFNRKFIDFLRGLSEHPGIIS